MIFAHFFIFDLLALTPPSLIWYLKSSQMGAFTYRIFCLNIKLKLGSRAEEIYELIQY